MHSLHQNQNIIIYLQMLYGDKLLIIDNTELFYFRLQLMYKN